MKRVVLHHRRLFVISATLLAVASLAWGATSRPRATKTSPVATATRVTKAVPAAPVASKPAVKHLATPVAVSTVANVATSAVEAPGSAGLRIFSDPQSGDVGPPTPENLRLMATESAGKEIDVANLKQVKSAISGWELDTSGIEDALVMTIDQNGNRSTICTKDPSKVHAQAKQNAKKTAPVPVSGREDR